MAVKLVPMFRRELQLCQVKPGETVAILTQGLERLEYAQAFSVAAAELGAKVFHVDLPLAQGVGGELAGRVGQTGLSEHPLVVEAFKQCDLLIDLVFLLFSKEQLAIQAANTRILLCVEPPETLTRMFPAEDHKRRVLEEKRMLERAKTLRFTNDAGTDVIYELGQYPAVAEYGFADEPGRWDHFPSGFAFTGGNDDGVNGVVVLQPGDIVFPFKRYVQEPVRFTICKGRVEKVEGGFDATLIAEYMKSFDDPNAYGISHIGFGLNERARWDVLVTENRGIGMDGRAFLGNVLFSTGPNAEIGGSNDTACHLDIPMRDCSLWLDDQLVVHKGQVVIPSLLPNG
ncbi:MAG: leucyl aminopeptidase [Alicyclobacillus sp.]|nr:leucyl aminopeptidase [Alicyclobacillus sp.]